MVYSAIAHYLPAHVAMVWARMPRLGGGVISARGRARKPGAPRAGASARRERELIVVWAALGLWLLLVVLVLAALRAAALADREQERRTCRLAPGQEPRRGRPPRP